MLECEACGELYGPRANIHVCQCGEPLRFKYLFGEIKEGTGVWKRYADFLPFEVESDLTIGGGNTPLSKAPKLSDDLGIELYLKNETMNPTWSFKDRGTVFSLRRALDLGMTRLGTVSTGNMAASVSAYGANNEMQTFVLVPADISEKKIRQISIYGPKIIKVDGDYGDLYYESFELAGENIYFTNSNSPFRVEGYKTIAFEIFEEKLPSYVMIPTSSGGLFRGISKGFRELEKSGMIDEMPTLVSVQAEGCSPIVEAYRSGHEEIKRWSEPDTFASAISNPYPPGGNDVLRKLDRYDGICVGVSDEDIIAAQREIANEGIFCQPSSSVALAGLKILRKQGTIENGSDVVSIITGSGLKTRSAVDLKDVINCGLDNLEDCLDRFFKYSK